MTTVALHAIRPGGDWLVAGGLLLMAVGILAGATSWRRLWANPQDTAPQDDRDDERRVSDPA